MIVNNTLRRWESMRYFRLWQDERIESGFIMGSVPDAQGMRQAIHGDISQLEEFTVQEASTFRGRLFTEILSRHVFMFKDSVREVFDIYLPGLAYKKFCIIDKDHKDIHAYYSAPGLEIIQAAMPKNTGSYLSADNICLDKQSLEDRDMPDIFRLAEPKKHIIVSLPVAESLLRRAIPGIRLTYIEMV
jgi:hypothetical protein